MPKKETSSTLFLFFLKATFSADEYLLSCRSVSKVVQPCACWLCANLRTVSSSWKAEGRWQLFRLWKHTHERWLYRYLPQSTSLFRIGVGCHHCFIGILSFTWQIPKGSEDVGNAAAKHRTPYICQPDVVSTKFSLGFKSTRIQVPVTVECHAILPGITFPLLLEIRMRIGSFRPSLCCDVVCLIGDIAICSPESNKTPA